MDTPQDLRNQVIALSQHTSMTTREIATRLNMAQSTVSDLIRRHRETGSVTTSRRGSCGRKRTTTKRADALLLRESMKNPRLDALALRRNLGITASVHTVRRRLVEGGRPAIKPITKPILTTVMKKKRLAWAHAHRNWTLEQWRKVIFTDESTFCVQLAEPRFVRRGREPISPHHMIQKAKFPNKVMVWGQICYKGCGRIYIVDGTVTGIKYIDILRGRCLPQANEWYPDGDWILQHDLAPCHTAKVVKTFIASEGITVLPWPGNSPDMNPIERMWAIIKQKLRAVDLTSKQQLINKLLDICVRDTLAKEAIFESCKKLIDGMPKRCEAVIKAKGGHTEF